MVSRTAVPAVGTLLNGGIVACTIASGGIANIITSTADDSVPIRLTDLNANSAGAFSPNYGFGNTRAFVVQGAAVPSAVTICDGLGTGGYNGWYLPSIEELRCIYQNRAAIEASGANFANNFYWSSTEFFDQNNINTFTATALDFSSGIQLQLGKISTRYIRCVRRFEPGA